MHLLEKIRTPLSIFTISLSLLICNAGDIQAELAKSSLGRVRFIQSPLISHARKPPGRQRGASSRGSCPTVNLKLPLTAIVPATLMGETKPGVDPSLTTWQSVGGLTSTANPDFVFYIPEEIAASPKEFVLQDSSGRNIYMTSFTQANSTRPGFTRIRIPLAFSLETNKIYRWFFLVNCDADAPYEVDGWIQRVALNPALSRQLQFGSKLQQTQVLAANGIWYDALSNLIELRRANPQDQDLLSDWVELLDSVGLKDLALGPISPCCQPGANANKSKPIPQ